MIEYYEPKKPPFFSMTWEQYHEMQKPVIKLESLINFKPGQIVKLNPDNHGFERPLMAERAMKRVLEVLTIQDNGMIRVVDTESGDIRKYFYQNLIITE